MADYESSENIYQPEVGAPDLNRGFEEAKQNIGNFFNSLENIGTRFAENKAKEKAPLDVEKGTFKGVPALSSIAEAYNQAGEQFEQSAARQQLHSAAEGLQETLLGSKVKAGIPIQDSDIQSFNQNYGDIVAHVRNSVSDASKPYVDTMGAVFSQNAGMGIQNRIDAQNKSINTYSALQNVTDLNRLAGQAAANGNIDLATNYLMQAKKASESDANVVLLGPVSAHNLSQNTIKQAAITLGDSLANAGGNPEHMRQYMDQIGAQLGFSAEDRSYMHAKYESTRAQNAQEEGLSPAVIGSQLTNFQKQFETGNKVDDDKISSLVIQANKLPSSSGVAIRTHASALQQAQQISDMFAYAPEETRNKEIQKLTSLALKDSGDPSYIMGMQMALKNLSAIQKASLEDSAGWAQNAPYIRNLMQKNQLNLDTQKMAGHQLATSNLNTNLDAAVMHYQQVNNKPLSVIPKVQAEQQILQITEAPDFATGVQTLSQVLNGHAQLGAGDIAKQDLIKRGLPGEYLLALNLPNNSAARNNFNAAMSTSFDPQKIKEVTNGSVTWDLVQQQAQSSLSTFNKASFNVASPNAPMVTQSMLNAVQRYSAYLVSRGKNLNDSVDQSVNELIGNTYSIKNNLLIPKSYDADKITDTLDSLRNKLIDKAQMPSKDFVYTNEANKAQTLSVLRNASWALKGDQSGYVLMQPGGIPLPYEVSLNELEHGDALASIKTNKE